MIRHQNIVSDYAFTYELEAGETIHIDGIPYEYMGNGFIATNTGPTNIEPVTSDG